MRVLFLHDNFPAQFRHIAEALIRNPQNQVLFGTRNQTTEYGKIRKVYYRPSREPSPSIHHYVRPLESCVLNGQAAFRMATNLKAKGFVPDIVYGHSGWGPTLYMKDVFPKSKLMCYFEWFYHANGADSNFDPADPLQIDDYPRLRTRNAGILLDLYTCDRGLSPTQWQKSQFPVEFHPKISTLFDGIDTDYFHPVPNSKLVLPNLDLSHVDELVTYVARGMEPYRGFPQFIESLAYLQELRPNCHAVIVAAERVCYGKSLPDGLSYKTLMLDKVPLDLSRVHFVGTLPYGLYRKVLQASDVHVYLTRPFVLSWSMMEALSSGCLVIGSATAPVQEVIQEGYNGLLVDFFSPQQIAQRVNEVLNNPTHMAELRQNARKTILEQYDLKQLLPQHLKLMEDVINGSD